MITETQGNLLRAPVEALINTVNTEGVMGKGIALQFKRAYPDMFKEYQRAARAKRLRLGEMHVWRTGLLENPKFIINFPTKGHWRSKSSLADIQAGLVDLVEVIQELGINSIAVPPLGCGNGGLDWVDVEPVIRGALNDLVDVDIWLYPPEGAPAPEAMSKGGAKPRMTPGRAALVSMIAKYMTQSLAAPSLVEVQKLMYFLQADGEPLRLRFEKNNYGPYADNLRHVLVQVEGSYLEGYGDGAAKVFESSPLRPLDEGLKAAEASLVNSPDTVSRMQDVLRLVDGFETAYGLELLATVHWLAIQDPDADASAITAQVAAWSSRKSRMFSTRHVESALRVLREQDWLAKSAA